VVVDLADLRRRLCRRAGLLLAVLVRGLGLRHLMPFRGLGD